MCCYHIYIAEVRGFAYGTMFKTTRYSLPMIDWPRDSRGAPYALRYDLIWQAQI